MIINFDTITLSFLVVAAVTLAVVSVLVWYVYSSKKFRKDIIELMDEKLSDYINNLEPPKQEEEEELDIEDVDAPEETEEEPVTAENFVEKDFVEKPHE